MLDEVLEGPRKPRRQRPSVAAGHKPPTSMPRRPRRPVFSQGTQGRRQQLAAVLKRLHSLRQADQMRLRAGVIRPATYQATWQHGNVAIRRIAEEVVRRGLRPSDGELRDLMRGVG